MPELPEVEAVARTLRPLVERRRIRCVHVLHAIATKPQSPSHLARTAEGQQIQSVQRKGKYLWLQLERGIVTLHFKLDGQLLWFSNAKKMFEVANQEESGVHVDVAFELDKGVLGFADGRHFGRVLVYESEEACPALARLGVDAISPDFTPARFAELLSRSRRPLKEFLLDQTRVAGIGNIYSCESLWHAKLDPRRRANSLKPAEARRPPQSDCFRSRACLRMLSASAARFSRLPSGGFKAWKKFFAFTTAKKNHAVDAVIRSNASRKAAVQLTFVRTAKNSYRGQRPIA